MPYFVTVTGGSGSGKTYLLHQLQERIGKDNLCIISQDDYYRPAEEQPVDGNGVLNFDMPESIDHEAFHKDICALQNREVVQKLEYTFNNPDLKPTLKTFNPLPLVIVEGLFALHTSAIREMANLKVFIDASDHTKIIRRIKRDAIERGYDLDDVLYRYEHHVMPSYRKHVDVHKHDADIIIPNDCGMEVALNVLVTFLESKVKG